MSNGNAARKSVANVYHSVAALETDPSREMGGIDMMSGRHKMARFDVDKSLSIFFMTSTPFDKSFSNSFMPGTSSAFQFTNIDRNRWAENTSPFLSGTVGYVTDVPDTGAGP